MLIVTALYAEAWPFIKSLALKRDASFSHYQFYRGEGVDLIITGCGRINAACALTEVLTKYSYKRIVNYGCAGAAGEKGIFRINKITEEATGRDFYPDVFENGLRESALTTSDRVKYSGNGLFDMEASAIYQAAVHFNKSSEVYIIKFVSDTLSGDKPDAKMLQEMACDYAQAVLEEIKLYQDKNADDYVQYHEETQRLIAEVCEKHLLSQSMANELKSISKCVYLQDEGQIKKFNCMLENYKSEPVLKPKNKERAGYASFAESLRELCFDYIREPGECKRGRAFSHIYAEDTIDFCEISEIIRKTGGNVIPIRHMKDVFNKKAQDYEGQKNAPALILARKKDAFLYEGARVCQSFGHEHFYYVSMIMNCVYDCEYCYLGGMYPSGNIAVYVNIEDYFKEIKRVLKEHSLYLCVSFDTDMLALESVLGYGRKWCEFALENPEVTIEIRTKSNAEYFLSNFPKESVPKNVILAWTLSPKEITDAYEHGTASLSQRLQAMKKALNLGFKIRACFDPAIYCGEFEKIYGNMIDETFEVIDPPDILDVSIGTFRISTEYLREIRDNKKTSEIVYKPYTNCDGVSTYPQEKRRAMIEFLTKRLEKYVPHEKIFNWE